MILDQRTGIIAAELQKVALKNYPHCPDEQDLCLAVSSNRLSIDVPKSHGRYDIEKQLPLPVLTRYFFHNTGVGQDLAFTGPRIRLTVQKHSRRLHDKHGWRFRSQIQSQLLANTRTNGGNCLTEST
jgi:hypothetical protein